jgi:hypothetical protein
MYIFEKQPVITKSEYIYTDRRQGTLFKLAMFQSFDLTQLKSFAMTVTALVIFTDLGKRFS